MLRAVRFAAKLGFTLDPATRAPIRELAPLLEKVPPARLFDEMLKLLLSGHASACLRQLRKEGLHHGLLPLLDVILEQPLGERFVTLALAQTDERVRTDRPVSPAFLFAALLWHEVLAAWKARQGRGERPLPALESAMDDVLDAQCEKLAITRKLTATMREIWAHAAALRAALGTAPLLLIESPRFRMGYDFLALRAASGEVSADVEAWWRAFQQADAETRKAMLMPETAPKKRRRRRRKKPPSADTRADAVTRVTAYVGLGSNLDRPREQVLAALDELERLPQTRLVSRSRLYRSAPLGHEAQPDFVNAVARIDTGLRRPSCSRSCRRSRSGTGASAPFRMLRARWTSTFCSTATRSSPTASLTVPHPRMHQRAFVLRPLAEICPAASVPGRGTAAQLLRACPAQDVEPMA